MTNQINKELFGKTSKGEDVYKFTLTNKTKASVGILNFGCVLYEINLPDKDGNIVDVNLGFDNVKDYEGNNNYFGALCGRVANRIGNAKFTLDGNTYELSKNDPFGGHMRVWDYEIEENRLILSYTDPDGSEGLPGDVVTKVTYTFDDDGTLTMDYKSTTNKPTVVDMGSHFMVNLAGHGKGAIRDHVITINADKYLEMGDDFLPTGKFVNVDDDKVMDFRKPKTLEGDVLENLTGKTAFHHAYVFNEDKSNNSEKIFMARVDHPESKRFMEVYSTNKTVFAYSNHYMDVIMKDIPCKDGIVYQKYAAIEFMPMGYPNSINQENFPQSVLRPGEEYHQTAWYKFGVGE
ncbi:hypothetical protein ACF0H5_002703 [Mactra antiquata]